MVIVLDGYKVVIFLSQSSGLVGLLKDFKQWCVAAFKTNSPHHEQ
jgi:hypothetical protein